MDQHQQTRPAHGLHEPEPVHLLVTTRPDGSQVMQTRPTYRVDWGHPVPLVDAHGLNLLGEPTC